MTDKWIRDTGLIFALFGLYLAYKEYAVGLPIAAASMLAVMFVPGTLKPLAWVWKQIAEGLGFVMQRMFFGAVFFVVITPIAFIRRSIGHDPLAFSGGVYKESAFIPHVGGAVRREQLARPY